ncbi:transposase [Moorena producens PAL-8-15-08-1]|uniref:Transposase n=1 Tax=Moorena producens PAL-8-15-08-1 TaxID=1458985 RepID=A0A1D8TR88_9CYAN|nr:transposase [Moorena producens]AOX00162.1 transposase [Moorena producens PAL-8-15-08-1]
MTNQRADYDNPWKEAISLYFQPFMAFLFPEIEENIDWDKGYEFLDKEFQQIARDGEISTREADKLVKVWRTDGQETWVLIHVEVQSQYESVFAERIYVYNYRIFDKYRRQVVSLAVLADESKSWRPNQYSYTIWGCEVLLRFPIVKLLDYSSQVLEESNNPFAVIVAAHRANQQTKQDVQQRYQIKLQVAKRLYQRGYGRQDILELFRLIDWLISLPDNWQTGFTEEIRRYEEESSMRYITSFERLARQEGIEIGLLEKGREWLLEVLRIRFEDVPRELVETINQIKEDSMLTMLHRQAITIASVEEFIVVVNQQLASGEQSS